MLTIKSIRYSVSSNCVSNIPEIFWISSNFIQVCLRKLIMCDRSSVEKPAFKKVIGVIVAIPYWFNASVINVCGIIGDTFEIIIHLD